MILLLIMLLAVVAALRVRNSEKTGKIILFNGVSSSGKSAILNKLSSLNKKYVVLKIDNWFPDALKKKALELGWDPASGIDPWFYLHQYMTNKTNIYYFDVALREQLFNDSYGFYKKANDIAMTGTNVIIDTVLEYPKAYAQFDTFFKNEKVLKILVYCPMDILLQRVETRNASKVIEEQRLAFQSFEQFPAMFKVQEDADDQVVDIVQSSILVLALQKAIEDLHINNVPDPYLPKLAEFKQTFIREFKLDVKDQITLAARHKYDLIINSGIHSPRYLAEQITHFLES